MNATSNASMTGAIELAIETLSPGRSLPMPIDCWWKTSAICWGHIMIDVKLPSLRSQRAAGMAGNPEL